MVVASTSGRPGLRVLVEDRPGERLQRRGQGLGGQLAGLLHLLPHPALREPHGPPGDLHARPVLAEQVVEPVDQLLARDRPVGDARLLQRLPDDRPRRPPQQRPVQIEERRAVGHGRRP